MVSDLKLVIRLQDLDNRIRDLQKEVTSLPKHIALIEKTLESHIRKLETDRAAQAVSQRERKRLEGDIQAQEQKISKLRDQMLQAKTNEQYAAFRTEIEYAETEKRRHEDGILEQMSETERLDQNVKAAEAELAKEKQQVEAEKTVARERTAQTKHQLDELKKERAGIAATVTPSVYKIYTRLRTSRKGIAVAEETDGACGACHMALRLQFFQDLRRGDSVMCCESCGRIIYYTPPPAEPDTAESQAVESNR
jgi:predicted  nucleic acid-binding Zn-ribbon protein